MRQLLQYGIRLGQQQNSADLSPEDLLREATVRLLHVVFSYLLTDEWFAMVSGWSRSSKQSRDANIPFPHHRLEQERGGTTMHTITHCFFSQSRLYSSHPWTFRSCNLALTQCMLNNSTCLYSLCKKAEHDPLHHSPVHACTRPSYTLLPYSFYDRADINALLQCLIRPFLIYFFSA